MVVSVVRMFQRFFGAIKYAAKEESFAAVFAAAILLVFTGTVTYALQRGLECGRRLLLRGLHSDHVEHR